MILETSSYCEPIKLWRATVVFKHSISSHTKASRRGYMKNMACVRDVSDHFTVVAVPEASLEGPELHVALAGQ